MNLPIIQSCDDCGACCSTMSAPPFITYDPELDAEDIERCAAMPSEAQAAIAERNRRWNAGEAPADEPCCWLDPQTLRCRWYEFRPQICRDFERGTTECLAWRAEYNIDVQQIMEAARCSG